MTDTRIYLVTDDDGPSRLVEAANPAQALRHVARGRFVVRVAGSLDVARLMKDGVSVEQAGAESAAA